VIASSGMCEAGRILHHLKNGVGKRENIVLIVGYMAANTVGRRLLEGEKTVRIFGEEHEVRCEVARINGFSAHAAREELSVFVKNIEGLRGVFVVPGEEEASNAFAQHLRERGIQKVAVPGPGESFVLD